MERLAKSRKSALLILAVLLLFCSFVGLIGVILLQERTDALDRARLNLSNLKSTAESGLDSVIHSFELSLDAAVYGLEKIEIESYPSAIQRAILFDRSTSAPQFGAIVITDAAGRIMMTSRDREDSQTAPADQGVPATGSVANRAYFLAHAKRGDVGLYVSDPFLSPLSKEWVIVFSRRVTAADGSFAGIVAGSLKIAYLQNLLDGLELGKRGVAALLRTDGTILVRAPSRAGDAPSLDLVREILARIDNVPRGMFEAPSLRGSEDRLYAYARLEKLPIVLAISASKLEILAEWKWRSYIIVLALVMLLTFAAILLLRFFSELEKRRNAESALKKAARQLRQLSLTDSLTGLANRRSFDLTFKREWARHIRDTTAFALLLIDIDHFKAYNDQYGHLAGDGTLSLVARLIEAEAKRPVDLAARYGGEEFALILPDTNTEGACTVAERIRASLADEKVLHAGGIKGVLTMSIGVAAVEKDEAGWDARKLLEAADAGLYQAKNAGRDRISTYRTLAPTAVAAA